MLFRRSCPLPGTRRPPWHRRLRTAVTIAVTAPVGRYLSRQAAHPRGSIGRLIVWNWLRETAGVNDIAVDLLDPQAGERICEIGCGPGRTLARLAAAGAHVTGVDNAGKLDYLRELGADAVVDYAREDFTRLEPFDLILDLVAHRSLFAYRRALARGGRYLCVGGSVRTLLRIVTLGAALGLVTGRRLGLLIAREGPEYFGPVAERCIAGDLRIHIDRTFSLDEVPQALGYLGDGRALGKVVITP